MRAGLPDTVAGMSVDRQCASGMMAIATAAKQILHDDMQITIGGGLESISLVQTNAVNRSRAQDPELLAEVPGLYMTMIETAELVAERYGISREAQDEYALRSQQRTAAGQQAGAFDDEIVAMPSVMLATDRNTGETSKKSVSLGKDEGNRPETNLEGLASLKPVFKDGQIVKEGKFITAGNASQLSDGASAAVLMEEAEASRRGLHPLGIYRGMAVAGCAPDEMGIGPVFAVPKLLQKHGLTVDDIDLWELNEAFACQVLYCRDRLGIPHDKLNVNGGAISFTWPSIWHVGRADGWACVDRGQAARREVGGGDDVRWRGDGRGGVV